MMGRFDQDTLDFMQQVAGDTEPAVKLAEDRPQEPAPETTADRMSLRPIRVLKQLVTGMDNPKKAISKAIIRAATGELMSKEGTIKTLSLYKFMNDHYRRAWWDWEPETIWATLEEDHLDGTPDELKNAVMALQVILNTFAPFEHWHIFENVGHAFNMSPVSFDIVQPLEPEDAALTIHVLSRIRPNTEYDSEVLQYISTCAKVAGMVYLPEDMFPGIQKHLDEITFEYALRDATKKAWETQELPKDAVLKEQVEIQIYRLLDVKRYLLKEGGDA